MIRAIQYGFLQKQKTQTQNGQIPCPEIFARFAKNVFLPAQIIRTSCLHSITRSYRTPSGCHPVPTSETHSHKTYLTPLLRRPGPCLLPFIILYGALNFKSCPIKNSCQKRLRGIASPAPGMDKWDKSTTWPAAFSYNHIGKLITSHQNGQPRLPIPVLVN